MKNQFKYSNTKARGGQKSSRENDFLRQIQGRSDCKSVVDQINASHVQDISIATVLEDIEELKEDFEECNFSFVYRAGNMCSHTLAQNAIKLVHDIEWNNEFPVWLMDMARKDMRAIAPFCN